ncbi:MAG: Nif3-like dinuclear metal center hexameric protein [Acidobacteriota bacterium]
MSTLNRVQLTEYLDRYLAAHEGRDYGPNGLQVEGRDGVSRVALGVTASLAFIEQAVAWNADVAIVHHGLFWRGAGELRVERSLRARLKALLSNDLTLLAYHLPLDRHPEVGNNAVLARRLGATQLEPAFSYEGLPVGVIARFDASLPVRELVQRIADVTAREPLTIAAGPEQVQRIGIVTGGAANLVQDAARMGLELFLTGEPSEPAVHIAREERIHFVAAGHHATETFGVQAVGEHLAQRFGIEARFIDVPNPV